MKLLIIADDLTGTMDTAVQFAKAGADTAAMLRPQGDVPMCEVLSVNTGTRHLTPDEAYRCITRLLAQYPSTVRVYLKTDSVLRGNISAMFAAVLDSGRNPIMFAPAYPKAGRTTLNGRQYLEGLPLEQSAFSKDPLNAMKTSNVNELLNKSHEVLCRNIPVGGQAFPSGVSIFDCETQEELYAIADRLAEQGQLKTTSGCAGFAEALAREFSGGGNAGFVPTNSPVLFLSGSANSITFKQLEHARASGMELVVIPNELKLAQNPNLDKLIAKLRSVLAEGRSVILATAASEKDLIQLTEDEHARLQKLFARVTAALSPLLYNLAVFGGDTALAVLDELEISTVKLICEIQTGVPLCKAGNLVLVTKSGGLGGTDAALEIEKYLRYGN